jgi:hypothetical protein
LVDAALRGNKWAAADAQKLRSTVNNEDWKDAHDKFVKARFDPKQLDGVLQPAQPK